MRPLHAIAGLASGIAWLAGTALALLAALLLSAWLWSAQAGSLPRALDWLQDWLQQPDGSRPLQVRDASGSLREGGRIGQLRWQRDGLEIELEGLELRWPASLWPDLLRGELQLDALELDRLRLRDDSPASPERQPPADLLLPWLKSIRLPLRVNAIAIAGQPDIALGPLRADYRYGAGPDASPRHELQLHQLRWADGDYRLDASLQAAAPMQLRAELQGEVQALAPGGRRQALFTSARLAGALGGPEATLELQADARPSGSTSAAAALQLRALISPWAALPLPSAELELREIDLAAFWPQAPRTRLQGRWRAYGTAADGAWRLQGELRNLAAGPWQRGALPLHGLHAELVHAGGSWRLQALDAGLIEGGKLQATGRWDGRQLQVERAELALATARAHASGTLDRRERRLDGRLELELPGASASLQSDHGGGKAGLVLADAQRLQRWLERDLARWLPRPAHAALQAGSQRLAALQGQAGLTAGWSGPLRLDRLPQAWQAGLDIPALQLQLQPQTGRASGPLQFRDWRIALEGRDGQVDLRLDGAASSGDWNADARLLAQATLDPDRPGRGAELVLQSAELRAVDALRTLSASIASGTRLRWQGGDALTLAASRASLQLARRKGQPAGPPAELAWEESRWAQGRLASRGRLGGLTLGWLDLLLSSQERRDSLLEQAGLAGDMALQAEWELDLPMRAASPASAPARARLEIARSSGELELRLPDAGGGRPQAIGLERASASLALDGGALSARLRWESRLAGRLDASLGTELAPPRQDRADWSWPLDAPLSGRLQASLPRLDVWSRLAPPGWRISGSLQADASLGGTRLRPEWQGRLQAGDLALRSQLDGLDFSGGELRATLDGEQIRLDSLKLRGAGGEDGGELLGSGWLRWQRAETAAGQPPSPMLPVLALELQARQLRLLARADRRLTLSGKLAARTDGRLLDVSGRLRADQALFILPDEDRPTLGDDVVVRGSSQPVRAAGSAALPLRLQLEFALGDDFQLRGQGLDTRLTGELRLDASPGQAVPQLVGQVRTVSGRYRAWGQALEIEEGLLNFNGPYDRPGLDILALRPLADQRVGVKIGGTALAPRVSLYSDPELPESEKLAWLVLGRPAGAAGAEAALLQQAALALLSGRGKASDGGLQRALGLDEISFRGETQKADGSSSAAALTLGKRLSRQLYLSYSRSVIGTTGTVAVLYDLTRQLTLRAKAGDDNALELVFTRQYDGRRARPQASDKAVR